MSMTPSPRDGYRPRPLLSRRAGRLRRDRTVLGTVLPPITPTIQVAIWAAEPRRHGARPRPHLRREPPHHPGRDRQERRGARGHRDRRRLARVPDSGSVVWMSAGTIRGFDLRNGSGTAVTYEPRTQGRRRILVYFRVLNEWPDVTIRDNWIHANRITAPRGRERASRAYFGRADIAGNRLFDNRIDSPQTGSGAAMYLSRWNYIDPYVVERNEIFDNHVLLARPGRVLGRRDPQQRARVQHPDERHRERGRGPRRLR